MTGRDWDPDANGLDELSIHRRIDGVMDGALAELARIEAEHDLGPDDIRRDDPVLGRLDAITAGRVGQPYSSERLQKLVEEAILYRFPSEIPPGYRDTDSKENPYRAAGDYILWRQVLDHAKAYARGQLLVLVTNDAKEDWWILDDKGRPKSGRPELKQELFDCSGAVMAQMMLSNFLEQVAEYYPDQISPDTVSQVRESELAAQIDAEISASSLDSRLDLMKLSPTVLEHLVRQLLEAMGYEAFITRATHDSGFDIDAIRPTSGSERERTLVEVKRYRSVVSPETVRALYGTLQDENADQAMIITTSWFASSSKVFAQGKSLTLVEGTELLALLREHLGIEAIIPERRKRPTGDT
ncbi:hypothetical protein CFP66_28030 [Pseudonocardia sp. MH-G8]|nr:hypothetical protein CFP66_28030 [Pseudonocardia sp. MH-G8]